MKERKRSGLVILVVILAVILCLLVCRANRNRQFRKSHPPYSGYHRT